MNQNNIDISKLKATEHMFEWIAKDPFNAMISEIEKLLSKQVPNTKIERFEAVSEPQWLTGGMPDEEDESKVILVRTGVAVDLKMTVSSPDGEHQLKGIYTWVWFKEEDKPFTRIWMDFDGTLEEFGSKGLLASRIYGEE